MRIKIAKRELIHAQLALVFAIALQFVVLKVNESLTLGPQYFIIGTEVVLAFLLGITLLASSPITQKLQKLSAGALLGLISFANLGSLILVLHALIIGHAQFSGEELLSSAIAIFITNIIVYAVWYWEIDSPGLTNGRWSKNERDFQFTQQSMKLEFPRWHPEFFDYLYLSLTNAINFAPADTRPLSRMAKFLMSTQALVSVFTLALVLARSVSVLG